MVLIFLLLFFQVPYVLLSEKVGLEQTLQQLQASQEKETFRQLYCVS